MKYTFTEKKFDASGELREYSQKKIGKLEKFFKNESDAFVTFSYERGRYTAEGDYKKQRNVLQSYRDDKRYARLN